MQYAQVGRRANFLARSTRGHREPPKLWHSHTPTSSRIACGWLCCVVPFFPWYSSSHRLLHAPRRSAAHYANVALFSLPLPYANKHARTNTNTNTHSGCVTCAISPAPPPPPPNSMKCLLAQLCVAFARRCCVFVFFVVVLLGGGGACVANNLWRRMANFKYRPPCGVNWNEPGVSAAFANSGDERIGRCSGCPVWWRCNWFSRRFALVKMDGIWDQHFHLDHYPNNFKKTHTPHFVYYLYRVFFFVLFWRFSNKP